MNVNHTSFPFGDALPFFHCLIEGLNKELMDVFEHKIPEFLENYEDEVNEKLKNNYKIGDKFPGGGIIQYIEYPTDIASENGKVYLYFENNGGALKIPDLTEFPSLSEISIEKLEKIPKIETGFSFSNLSVTIEIGTKINLTDSSRAPFIYRGIKTYSIEIQKEFPSSILGVGIAKSITINSDDLKDNEIWGEKYLVRFQTINPIGLGLYGFVGKSHSGFIISIKTSGIKIPLGTTGFSLTGISMLFGERWAPRLDNASLKDPVDEVKVALPATMVDWAIRRAESDLTSWAPTKYDTRVYGLAATFSDSPTNGRLIKLTEFGIIYFSIGPTIWIGGKIQVLNGEEGKGTLMEIPGYGVIDCNSGTIFLRATTEFKPIKAWDELKVKGAVELQMSTKTLSNWYFAVGGYNLSGCAIELPWFSLSGGYRITSSHIAMAGSIYLNLDFNILGCEVEAYGSLKLFALFGWNPIQVMAGIDAYIKLGIRLFGKSRTFGVGLYAALSFPKPTLFLLRGKVIFGMTWPMEDKEIDFDIFNYEKDVETPEPESNLQLPDNFDALKALHIPSGRSSNVKSISDKNSADISKIWPDTTLQIPFKRIAYDQSKVIFNPIENYGLYREDSGVNVQHLISRIELYKIDISTGEEEKLNSVNGFWRADVSEKGLKSTSTLLFPSISPLSSYNLFNYSTPLNFNEVTNYNFQFFGEGVSTYINEEIYRLTPFNIITPNGFDLVNVPINKNNRLAMFRMGFFLNLGYSIKDETGSEQFEPILASSVVMLVFLRDVETVYDFKILDDKKNEIQDVDISRSEIEIGDEVSLFKIELTSKSKTPISSLIATQNAENRLGDGIMGFGFLPYRNSADIISQTILSPGRYRLKLEGSSVATLYDKKVKNWEPIDILFDVEKPNEIRPYILYSTYGDERIFEMPWSGWYPSPVGIGLPAYRSHSLIIRFREHYINKIFYKLYFTISNNEFEKSEEVEVKASAISRHQFTKTPWEFYESRNLSVFPSECSIDFVDLKAGSYKISIIDKSDNNESQSIKLDEWICIISKYETPTLHLTPISSAKSMITGLYGQFGYEKYIDEMIEYVVLPKEKSFYEAANYIGGRALPAKIFPVEGLEKNGSLCFFSILEYCRIFENNDFVPYSSPLQPSNQITLNLLLNQQQQAVGIIYRSDEPLDWRRVSTDVFYGNADKEYLNFGARIFPSPDGCSAIFILIVEKIPVIMPSEQFRFLISYNYEVDGLPFLRSKNQADLGNNQPHIDRVEWYFYQPFGKSWNKIQTP